MALFKLCLKDTLVDVLVIRQAETYGGILEGRLSSKLNQRVIERAKDKACFLWPNLTISCLIDDITDTMLPGVLCLSLLQHNSAGEFSRLILLHFEEDVRTHFSESTLQKLSMIEWSVLTRIEERASPPIVQD